MKFRNKSYVIDAMQWDGNPETLDKLINFGVTEPFHVVHASLVIENAAYGRVWAHVSDWIIKERDNSIAILSNATFQATYAPEIEMPKWKPISEHGNKFYDGDKYLVALRVLDRHSGKENWEFHKIVVSCDGEIFVDFKEHGTDNNFTDWSWDDFEFFIKFD